METKDKYIPGVCNIGPAEIARRKKAGWTGSVVTVILWASFIGFNAPHAWRLTLFIPAMMAATGFLQAGMHFCAYFGLSSLFNFGSKVGETDDVLQAEFRAKDRKKAWQIVYLSALIGIVVALVGAAL
ncbi:MAG: hypothetical protein WA090_03860 [Candidatus Nanopelagicaceae bacterium]